MKIPVQLVERLTLHVIDCVALAVNGSFREATVDLERTDDGPVVVRVAAASEGCVWFSRPSPAPPATFGALSSAISDLEWILVDDDRERFGESVTCRRVDLGACSVERVGVDVLHVGDEVGREQIANTAFAAALAELEAPRALSEARLAAVVTGGSTSAVRWTFDGDRGAIDFACDDRRTTMRAAWLGTYVRDRHLFRWIWSDPHAPDHLAVAARQLRDDALLPGHGALRLEGFIADPAHVAEIAFFAARRMGAAHVYTARVDGETSAFFAVFDAPS